jgi:hypothetical protein
MVLCTTSITLAILFGRKLLLRNMSCLLILLHHIELLGVHQGLPLEARPEVPTNCPPSLVMVTVRIEVFTDCLKRRKSMEVPIDVVGVCICLHSGCSAPCLWQEATQELYQTSVQEKHLHSLQPIVQPIWSLLERWRTIKLEGLVTVCMPAAMAFNYLDLEALAQQCSPATTASPSANEESVHGRSTTSTAPETRIGTSDVQSGAPSTFGSGASRLGGCGQLLLKLKQTYGADAYLKIARGAARDALCYGNARFDTHSSEPVAERSWADQDINNYLSWAWCEAS